MDGRDDATSLGDLLAKLRLWASLGCAKGRKRFFLNVWKNQRDLEKKIAFQNLGLVKFLSSLFRGLSKEETEKLIASGVSNDFGAPCVRHGVVGKKLGERRFQKIRKLLSEKEPQVSQSFEDVGRFHSNLSHPLSKSRCYLVYDVKCGHDVLLGDFHFEELFSGRLLAGHQIEGDMSELKEGLLVPWLFLMNLFKELGLVITKEERKTLYSLEGGFFGFLLQGVDDVEDWKDYLVGVFWAVKSRHLHGRQRVRVFANPCPLKTKRMSRPQKNVKKRDELVACEARQNVWFEDVTNGEVSPVRSLGEGVPGVSFAHRPFGPHGLDHVPIAMERCPSSSEDEDLSCENLIWHELESDISVTSWPSIIDAFPEELENEVSSTALEGPEFLLWEHATTETQPYPHCIGGNLELVEPLSCESEGGLPAFDCDCAPRNVEMDDFPETLHWVDVDLSSSQELGNPTCSTTWSFEICAQSDSSNLLQLLLDYIDDVINHQRRFTSLFEYRVLSKGEALLREIKRIRIQHENSSSLVLWIPVASSLKEVSDLLGGRFCFFKDGRYVSSFAEVVDCDVLFIKHSSCVPCIGLDKVKICGVCFEVYREGENIAHGCVHNPTCDCSLGTSFALPEDQRREPQISPSGFDGHDHVIETGCMHGLDWVQTAVEFGGALCNFEFSLNSSAHQTASYQTWEAFDSQGGKVLLTLPTVQGNLSTLDSTFKAFAACPLGIIEGVPWFFILFPHERHAIVRTAFGKDGVPLPGFRLLDIFAGIGGWQAGFLTAVGSHSFVAVDYKKQALEVLSRNFGLPILDVACLTLEECIGREGGSILVLGRVEDRRWWPLSISAPFHIVCGSPPCPPWSGAAARSGLRSQDGVSFTRAILIVNAFRPLISCLENVGALVNHPHFRVVEGCWRKFTGVKHEIKHLWLERVVPFKRHRIILCSFGAGVFDDSLFLPFQVRDETFSLGAGIFGAGAFCHASIACSEEVMVSNVVQDFAKRSDMLPRDWLPLNRQFGHVHPSEVLGARIFKKIDTCLPTLMAAYRSQREIPLPFLLKHKLLVFFIEDHRAAGGFRFLHSSEAAKLLGFPPWFKLPCDEKEAMFLLGNSMSPTQVVMLLRWFKFVGVRCFGDDSFLQRYLSGIGCGDDPISKRVLVRCDNFKWLGPPGSVMSEEVETSIAVDFGVGPFCEELNPPFVRWFVGVHPKGLSCGEVLERILPRNRRPWRVDSGRNFNHERPCYGGVIRIRLPSQQYVIEPFGLMSFHPLEQIESVQVSINRVKAGGHPVWQIRAGNQRIAGFSSICEADAMGVIRCCIYAGLGGAKTIDSLGKDLSDILIGHGVPEGVVAERVGQLMLKVPQVQIVRCFKTPDPWKALKEEASKVNFQIVTPIERERQIELKKKLSGTKEDFLQSDDPWKSYKPESRKVPNKSKSSRGDAESFQEPILDLEFFRSGCKLESVSFQALLSGQPGLALIKHAELVQNLERLTKERLTIEPALVIAPGSIKSNDPRVCNILAPAFVQGRPVAMKTVLVQVGDQLVTVPQSDQKISIDDVEKSTVIMVQIQRDEATEIHWSLLQAGMQPYLKAHAFKETRLFQNIWSGSFYQGKFKSSFEKATHWHCVARVYDRHLHEALKIGGLAGVYLHPKGDDRTSDERFRIVLLPGESQSNAFAMLSKVSEHLGLARSRSCFGVRVKREDYGKVKKVLRPDCDTSDEDGFVDKKRWALLNVPDCLQKKTIKQTLDKVGWTVAAIRPAGWKTWHVYADVAPPVLSFSIMGSQIVITGDSKGGNEGLFAAGSVKEWRKLAKIRHDVSLSSVQSIASPVAGPTGDHSASKFDLLKGECREEVLKALDPSVKKQRETETRVDDLAARVDTQKNDSERFSKKQQDTDGRIEALEAKVDQLSRDSSSRLERVEKSVEDLPKAFDQKLSQLAQSFTQMSEQRIKELNDNSQRNIQALEKRQADAISSQFGSLAAQFDSLKEFMMKNSSSPSKVHSPEHKKGRTDAVP